MIRRSRRASRRRPVAEINVVPYIDVMLVLLVIFMVTAPLVTSGIKVNLPKEEVRDSVSSSTTNAIIVSVTRDAGLFLDSAEDSSVPVSEDELGTRVAALLERNPQAPVMVRADAEVDYGAVVKAMAKLQAAGAGQVGLITVPAGPQQAK